MTCDSLSVRVVVMRIEDRSSLKLHLLPSSVDGSSTLISKLKSSHAVSCRHVPDPFEAQDSPSMSKSIPKKWQPIAAGAKDHCRTGLRASDSALGVCRRDCGHRETMNGGLCDVKLVLFYNGREGTY